MHATAANADRPKRHPDAAFRQVGEEGGLVVMPGRGEVKVLNPVGIKVFSLLDGRWSLEEIASAVFDEFEVTREQALADVREFVGELERAGMLEGSASAATGAKR